MIVIADSYDCVSLYHTKIQNRKWTGILDNLTGNAAIYKVAV